MQSKFDMRRIN